MTGVLNRLLPVCAVVAAVATGGMAGCTEINAAADHVAALEFDTLPFPSVVAGDSLRDSLGRAAPLKAVAFNTSGGAVANPAIQYLALDSGVTVGGDGFLVSQRRSGSVRLVASTPRIQSAITTLLIARPPAIVIVPGKIRDTVNYTLPDNPTTNVSVALGVQIITADTADGVGVTQGWLVSYQAFHNNMAVAPGDTSAAFLLGAGVQRSGLDTTRVDGTASRRVRVRPIGITSQLDSVVVIATVRYRGAAVRGSPVRFVILLRPK